jgi:ATP-dependent DNA helicase PIF1
LEQRAQEYQKWSSSKHADDAVRPTTLYSLRVDAELVNDRAMRKLTGKEWTYDAEDIFEPLSRKTRREFYDDLLEELAPSQLTLKIGAQVMITWNLSVQDKLCNGTRGVVTALSESTVSLTTVDGASVIIERIPFKIEDKWAKVTRLQFPLAIAFAITIHKAQGSTLDFCVLDLGPDVFAAGQAYVALSRARGWDSLLVSRFSTEAFKYDATAIEYMDTLQRTSLDPAAKAEFCKILTEANSPIIKRLYPELRELIKEFL